MIFGESYGRNELEVVSCDMKYEEKIGRFKFSLSQKTNCII